MMAYDEEAANGVLTAQATAFNRQVRMVQDLVAAYVEAAPEDPARAAELAQQLYTRLHHLVPLHNALVVAVSQAKDAHREAAKEQATRERAT
jgi:hypothetical protein